METAISSREVLVCQTCGAEGFTNAFVYCVKCLGFVNHRYCLDVIPNTPDELVIWFCEDCKPPLPCHPTSPPNYDPSQSRKEDPPNSALVKTTHPKKKRKKKPVKKRKFISLASAGENDARPKRITRCIVMGLKKPEHKSIQLQENVTMGLQPVETTKRKKLLNKKQKKKKESVPLLGKDEITKSSNEMCVEIPSDTGANKMTPQSAELDSNCVPVQGSVKRKRSKTFVAVGSCPDVTLKNEEGTEERLKCGPDHDKLVSNSASIEKELDKRSKQFDGSVYAFQSAYLENNLQCIQNQPARPVLEPVWRGSFSITGTDYDLLEGLVGHLSSIACKKVCEETTTLPSMLILEMDSKAHLWPKSFIDSTPSDENIALYFFPGDTKNERDFERLVDNMIDDDVAMKATSKNAELLIFTSKVLPQPFWRLAGNYYLWGVFRGNKKDVPVSNHSGNHGLSEVPTEKEMLNRVKTSETHSPKSPLCNYR